MRRRRIEASVLASRGATSRLAITGPTALQVRQPLLELPSAYRPPVPARARAPRRQVAGDVRSPLRPRAERGSWPGTAAWRSLASLAPWRFAVVEVARARASAGTEGYLGSGGGHGHSGDADGLGHGLGDGQRSVGIGRGCELGTGSRPRRLRMM